MIAAILSFFGLGCRHRMGSLAGVYQGADGWAYYDCIRCTRPQRLSARWAVPGARPRPTNVVSFRRYLRRRTARTGQEVV